MLKSGNCLRLNKKLDFFMQLAFVLYILALCCTFVHDMCSEILFRDTEVIAYIKGRRPSY